MPTIAEKLKNLNWDDFYEHLVALAYLSGQEVATRKICDIHNGQITAMRKAADGCRYHNMANNIISAGAKSDTIYDPNYAGDVTAELCDDEWPL